MVKDRVLGYVKTQGIKKQKTREGEKVCSLEGTTTNVKPVKLLQDLLAKDKNN